MRLLAALKAFLASTVIIGARAAQDINGKPILALGDDVPVDTPGTYWTPLHACPQPCGDLEPEKWTVYNSVQRLSACTEPMMLDFALHNSLKDENVVKIHACTVGNSAKQQDAVVGSTSFIPRRSFASPTECFSNAEVNSISLSINGEGRAGRRADDALLALEILKSAMQNSACGDLTTFVYTNGTVLGMYSGAGIDKLTLISLAKQLTDLIKSGGALEHMQSGVCDGDRNALQIAGISMNTEGNIATVQQDVVSWSKAKCPEIRFAIREVPNFKVQEQKYGVFHHSNRTSLSQTLFNATHPAKTLFARDDCRVITIVSGDTCGKLADRCGISAADFTKYNSGDDFCSTLSPDGRVCCSPGDLPDIRPKKNSDGSCASYLVKSGDDCPTLAGKNGLKTSDIEEFNKGTTWGWNGCEHLLASMNICLSEGDPPMPAPIDNAVCGPQKPGSTRPTDGTFIGNVNPCPLNACCNIWGQCGISGDFCVEKRGPLGNPGTAPPGVNGCVSSCGMGITNDREPPQHGYGRVGYYETWNMDRPCLNLPVAGANTDSSYTIIHWAFAEINSDWTVKINDPHSQWDDFKTLKGVKRVLSFGGWGYSTDPSTYDILRQAMSPANRATFAKNIVNFVNKEGLDGVDFDWEYPGALDIPGTPPGQPDDGINYLKFLMYLRSIVGPIDDMYDVFSISIAAPASYWYLKAFPIGKMSNVLDYIVYMTYDLHGQWDAGNKYSDEGCPSGNCLRSHVNLTETMTVLSMITKAGVSTYQIYVGESSYGRSFKMSQAGCTGPDCTFLGDRLNSPAAKGRCTQTSGYISNAEINEIASFGDNVQSFHDAASNSDIIVYNDTEWVAYMSETTKFTRRNFWEGYKFAGTIDWAVDLQSFNYDMDHNLDDDGDEWFEIPPPAGPIPDCNAGDFKSLDDVPKDAVDYCKNLYILGALNHILDDAMTHYNNLLSGGYEDKFNTYADAVVKSGNKAIEGFMFTKSSDYFDCTVTENVQCCAYCHHIHTTPDAQAKYCMYCGDYDCGWDPSCERYQNCHLSAPTYHDISVGCTDWSKRNEDPPQWDYNEYNQATCTWSMRSDKEDDFWKAFSEETGIDKSNVEFKTVERLPCNPSASEEQCAKSNHDVNFPVTHDYTREDIPNPEDLVKQIQGGAQNLGSQISDAISSLKAGTFVGSSYDIVDSVSLPVQMIEDAIGQMQTISDKIDEQNAEKRKSIILAFVTAIFLFIPVAGEVASSLVGAATIARIASIAGVAGNAALDIYTIVDDPDNAALAIVSLVFEPLALLDFGKIAKAARIRRGMKPEDVKALGAGKASRLNKIDDIRNVCKPKVKRAVLEWDLPMSSVYDATF